MIIDIRVSTKSKKQAILLYLHACIKFTKLPAKSPSQSESRGTQRTAPQELHSLATKIQLDGFIIFS